MRHNCLELLQNEENYINDESEIKSLDSSSLINKFEEIQSLQIIKEGKELYYIKAGDSKYKLPPIFTPKRISL